MKISILGLGWFGTPLAKTLKSHGHEVIGSTRSQDKLVRLTEDGINCRILNSPDIPQSDLLNADVIVLNIPPREGQLEWFKSWNISQNTWLIFISSTSEAPLLIAEEEWVKNNFSKWTILRFAGLIGGGRHPGKHLSGRKNLPGRLWPVNLIHQKDVVAVTDLVIRKSVVKEIVNVVSDEHPTREEFYTDYCQSKNLPLPEFDPLDSTQKSAVSSDSLKRFYSTFTSLKFID